MSKEHGAFPYFAARLSDCTYQVVREDLQRVKVVMMRIHALDDERAWRRWLNGNWWAVAEALSPSSRVCGRAGGAADAAEGALCVYPDAKTRLPLFSAATDAASGWHLWSTRPRGVSPILTLRSFHCTSSRAGQGRVCPIYGCSRGTVDLEGYHQKIALLLDGHSVGLEHTDAVLLGSYNFRWNLAMEAKYLGLDHDIKGFYELERVDAIQSVTYGWWRHLCILSIVHTETYADSGERFGLIGNLHPDDDEVAGQEDRKHQLVL